jgi:Nif-specific regulatory protein
MHRGTVTLKDSETGHLRICASHGLSPEEKARGIYRLDEGVTGLIFRTAQPFVVPDVSQEPLFLKKPNPGTSTRADLFIGADYPRALHGPSVDRLQGGYRL